MRLCVVIAVVLLGTSTAHARWYIYAYCPGADRESVVAFETHDDCAATLPATQERYPGCNLGCYIEGDAPERLGDMAYEVGQGIAEVFEGAGLRSYDPSRKGYPWGRSVFSYEGLPIGAGLRMSEGASGRFAAGPSTLLLRLLPRVMVGGFASFSFAATAGADELLLPGYGGELRIALTQGAFDVKSGKRDHGGYYELYVDAGYGVLDGGSGYGGTGRISTAAFGLTVNTGWMFGIGVSTRFSYGEIEGATPLLGGDPVDLRVQAWDGVLVHWLVLGL